MLVGCVQEPPPRKATPDEVAALPEIDPSEIGPYKVGKPYQIFGIWYYPQVEYDYVESGIASWYGPGFHGKKTANGETYDQDALTAAHRTLPLPSMVRVTNLENGRSLILRLNDRGPFARGRIIDLSRRAADLLGVIRKGTAKVRVEVLEEESRALAAIAQGRDVPSSRPKAAPTIAVAAVPLDSPEAEASKPQPPQAASEVAAIAPGPVMVPPQAKNGPPRPPGLWRHRRAMANARAAGAPTDVQLAALPGTQVAPDLLSASRSRFGRPAVPWPDGQVTQNAATPTNLYVQAGSFLRRDYATQFKRRLSVFGRTAVTQAEVNGRWFFRVRLGPLSNVAEADRVLDALIGDGVEDARIVVD